MNQIFQAPHNLEVSLRICHIGNHHGFYHLIIIKDSFHIIFHIAYSGIQLIGGLLEHPSIDLLRLVLDLV